MKMKKNKFWCFVFSCIPGAGQMYLGFLKRGVSIMLMFFAVIAAAGIANMDIILYLVPVIWFFGFFDSINRNSMPEEEFNRLDDHFIWDGKTDVSIIGNNTIRVLLAVILIVFGVMVIVNNTISLLCSYLEDVDWGIISDGIHLAGQAVIAIVIIVIGIRLIVGRKKEIEKTDTEE